MNPSAIKPGVVECQFLPLTTYILSSLTHRKLPYLDLFDKMVKAMLHLSKRFMDLALVPSTSGV